jgi:hypothetical protein
MDETLVPESMPAITELDFESNLMLGLIGGGIAMLVSAVLWGIITFVTGFQISWMAIGVGFFVGIAIQKLGNGKTLTYGVSGAVLSFLGCLLGNLFFYSGILAREWEVSFFDVLFAFVTQPDFLVEIFTVAFDFRDLLFYAVAAYIGFRAARGTTSKRQS